MNQVQGVNRVPLDLAHFVTGFVHDHPVQQDALERRLAHEVDAHHHHAGHPEEQDVVGRREIAGRIEPRKL